MRVSILLCSSPDVNETEIEIWREKTHYYTRVVFTIFVYYNVGSNLASSAPQLLSADISSPLRRPFRSERFNARRRRRRPRRATKKPYNSNNNNNTIVLYYTVAFVCVSHKSQSGDPTALYYHRARDIQKRFSPSRFWTIDRRHIIKFTTIYQLNNMLCNFSASESNTIILLRLYVPTLLIGFDITSQRHDGRHGSKYIVIEYNIL